MAGITYLTIIDTAVKVGLGGAIVALANHLNSKANMEHEVGKVKWEARKEFVREVLESSQSFIAQSTKLIANVDAAAKSIDLEEKLTKEHHETILDIAVELQNSQHFERCLGYLTALDGAGSKAMKYWWEYYSATRDFRVSLFLESDSKFTQFNIPTPDRMKEIRIIHGRIKKDFYESLNKYLSGISPNVD